MTTRRTLTLCAALLTVVAVGVVLRSLTTGPMVQVSFVGYEEYGAILEFTNKGSCPVGCGWTAGTVQLVAHRDLQGLPDHTVPWILLPRQGTQLLARSTIIHLVTEPPQPRPALPATVSVRCLPLASPLRRRIEVVLSKVGINIASTGFVATVTLPPWPVAPSLGSTNQPAP